MTFVPCRRSFWGSALFALQPAILAGATVLVLGDQLSRPYWILSGLMGLLSVYLFLQAVFVHRQRFELDDTSVRLVLPRSRIEIPWQDVESAVVRERENAITRTDRLLVLESAERKLVFNTSTLAPVDEESLLAQVRGRVRVVVYRDSPSV